MNEQTARVITWLYLVVAFAAPFLAVLVLRRELMKSNRGKNGS